MPGTILKPAGVTKHTSGEMWTIFNFVGLVSIQFTILRYCETATAQDTSIASPTTPCSEFYTDPIYGEHKQIVVNGIRLHYVEKGDHQNPVMIFLHGFPEFWHLWRHQLKHFAKTHWVVAPDMRGYGGSEKPTHVAAYKFDTLQRDIVELIRGLGQNSTILAGHDWGGIIAWAVTINFPHVVSKLIIINAPHPNLWIIPSRTSAPLHHLRSSYVLAFLIPYFSEAYLSTAVRVLPPSVFKSRVKALSGFIPQLDDEAYAAHKCHLKHWEAWTPMLNYYRSYVSHEAKPRVYEKTPLPNIHSPTLIIWGDKEFYLDPAIPELSKQFADDLRIEHVADASHFIVQEKPELVNRLIESFV